MKLVKVKLGNKTVEKNDIIRFCKVCSKKKIEELEDNPTLKNPKRSRVIKQLVATN